MQHKDTHIDISAQENTNPENNNEKQPLLTIQKIPPQKRERVISGWSLFSFRKKQPVPALFEKPPKEIINLILNELSLKDLTSLVRVNKFLNEKVKAYNILTSITEKGILNSTPYKALIMPLLTEYAPQLIEIIKKNKEINNLKNVIRRYKRLENPCGENCTIYPSCFLNISSWQSTLITTLVLILWAAALGVAGFYLGGYAFKKYDTNYNIYKDANKPITFSTETAIFGAFFGVLAPIAVLFIILGGWLVKTCLTDPAIENRIDHIGNKKKQLEQESAPLFEAVKEKRNNIISIFNTHKTLLNTPPPSPKAKLA